MARSLRGSRYRNGATVGEDVNPSAYIVNLADCMLVLALGCLVALVGAFNIDLNTTQIDREDLEQVDPTEIDEELTAEGSYYVEAGTVYMDPKTGELFMIQNPESDVDLKAGSSGASASGQGSQSAGAAGSAGASGSSGASGQSAGSGSSASHDDDVRNARANGAD